MIDRWNCGLVVNSSGCCNKFRRLGSLEKIEIYFSVFCRLEVQIRVPARSSSGEDPLLGCRLLTSCVLNGGEQREKASSLVTHIRALIPFVRDLPS